MEPSCVVMQDISSAWLQLHGLQDWVGLLDPLDPTLRVEILKYGRFSEATYDAYDPSCGSSCRYRCASLLKEVGLRDSGYEVTRYLYATMAELPRPPWPLSLLPKGSWLQRLLRLDSWSEDSNWMGFVAVSGDEETRRLGRREIVVAWRGTVEPSEWFKDAQLGMEPLKGGGVSGANVEQGFQSVYTSHGRFTTLSASEQVKTEIRRLVDTYGKEDSWKEGISLTLTGHSLGGALALLSAHDAAASIPGLSHVSVISFGAPQVGDAAFMEELSKKGVKVLRVVVKGDEVPKLPGIIDSLYEHAGVKLDLDMDEEDLMGQLDVAACHSLKTYLRLVESTKS
ncbi:hypothetical protein Taro_038821 [Colocasia esculenta]|uniref:Fungal lipase-type domain-containing protein n=1 Tax=Colocasia esculenta TaxID=4460 RepID=A0A843WKC7_COLES|nr:hypothetical protein [Colocasia esculenta]